MRFHLALIIILLDSYATTAVAAAAKAAVAKAENDKDEDKCGIYFAPSTIPGAGYGYVHTLLYYYIQ